MLLICIKLPGPLCKSAQGLDSQNATQCNCVDLCTCVTHRQLMGSMKMMDAGHTYCETMPLFHITLLLQACVCVPVCACVTFPATLLTHKCVTLSRCIAEEPRTCSVRVEVIWGCYQILRQVFCYIFYNNKQQDQHMHETPSCQPLLSCSVCGLIHLEPPVDDVLEDFSKGDLLYILN